MIGYLYLLSKTYLLLVGKTMNRKIISSISSITSKDKKKSKRVKKKDTKEIEEENDYYMQILYQMAIAA